MPSTDNGDLGFEALVKVLMEDTTTLASIGRELGLSRERVRQIELQAQSKLRRALESVA